MQQARNFLVIFTAWQMATAAAQENCPGPGIKRSLLGDIPISSCAPDLPLLPELACGRNEFIGGFPRFECGPQLPSLPYEDCSLPCLPSLPSSADYYDFPCTGEPLPYLKKKGCGCGCGRGYGYSTKQACLPTKAKSCGCEFNKCGLKKSCLEEKEDCGLGLKIVPLIKQFPLKKKKPQPECYDNVDSLPCELPGLISGVVRGSLYA